MITERVRERGKKRKRNVDIIEGLMGLKKVHLTWIISSQEELSKWNIKNMESKVQLLKTFLDKKGQI